jgi:hypothetical protein
MYGYKLGWIVQVIVFSVLIIVIGVGIYQINSNGNPWDFGGSDISGSGWYFLSK